MNGAIIALLIFLVMIVVVIAWFVADYNRIIKLRNRVKNAWSQIDVQLKRRHDLIPNLVETVKGYAKHEQDTLQGVIEARAKATQASGAGVKAQSAAEGELSQALGRLMMVVEQYPDLQANANFLALQEELTSTENKIGFARQAFNDSVMGFNTKIQSIPSNVVAGMFGFKEENFFELEDKKERVAPQVAF